MEFAPCAKSSFTSFEETADSKPSAFTTANERQRTIQTSARSIKFTTNNANTTIISVGDFVEASFANFEKMYGAKNNSQFRRYPENADKNKEHEHDNDKKSDDVDTTVFALLLETILYRFLPFVLLWTRRSMFGIASLIRTLLIGHVLRYCLICFSSVSFPSSVKERISSINSHMSILINAAIDPWGIVFGDNPNYKGSSGSFICYGGNTSGASSGMSWGNWIVLWVLGKMGGDPNSCPPQSLTLLALLTVFVFILNPDGLTQLFLRKVQEFIFTLLGALFNMIREGNIIGLIATAAISGILILFATFLKHYSFERNRASKTNRKDRSNGHHSKGKKKKGGRRGGNNHSSHNVRSRNCSRIKGGTLNASTEIQPLASLSEVSDAPCENNDAQSTHSTNDTKKEETLMSPVIVPPECPGRKLTDQSQDEMSASSVTTAVSCSLSIINDVIAKSTSSDHSLSKVKNEKGIDGTINSSLHNNNHMKRDYHRRNRKQKKQNSNYPNRNHNKQKKPFNNESLKARYTQHGQSPPPLVPSVDSSLSNGISSPNDVDMDARTCYCQPKSKKDDWANQNVKYVNTNYSSFFSSDDHHSVEKLQQVQRCIDESDNSSLQAKRMISQIDRSIESNHRSNASILFSGFIPSPEFESKNFSHHHSMNKAPGAPTSASKNSNSRFLQQVNGTSSQSTSLETMPHFNEKSELYDLLTKIGLVGVIFNNILKSVNDVSTLALFTDADYDLYNVPYEKRFQIRKALEEDKYSKLMKSKLNKQNLAIRPPPGLGFGKNQTCNPSCSSAQISLPRSPQINIHTPTSPMLSSNATAFSLHSNVGLYSKSDGYVHLNEIDVKPNDPLGSHTDMRKYGLLEIGVRDKETSDILPGFQMNHQYSHLGGVVGLDSPLNDKNGYGCVPPKQKFITFASKDEENDDELLDGVGEQMAERILDF